MTRREALRDEPRIIPFRRPLQDEPKALNFQGIHFDLNAAEAARRRREDRAFLGWLMVFAIVFLLALGFFLWLGNLGPMPVAG